MPIALTPSNKERILSHSHLPLQDGTLALQKSTLQVPRDADDWVLYNKKVPQKLQELESQGYTIVVFRFAQAFQHRSRQTGPKFLYKKSSLIGHMARQKAPGSRSKMPMLSITFGCTHIKLAIELAMPTIPYLSPCPVINGLRDNVDQSEDEIVGLLMQQSRGHQISIEWSDGCKDHLTRCQYLGGGKSMTWPWMLSSQSSISHDRQRIMDAT